jgi:uncharacterized Fe-S cluster protein YjdI
MATERTLVKHYATDEIVVEWEPRLCYHSGNCSRLLPKVFDRDRRPWVKTDEASADEIERTRVRSWSGPGSGLALLRRCKT